MMNEIKELKVVKGTPKHLFMQGELKDFVYLMINLPFSCQYRCLKCFNIEGIEEKIRSNDKILDLDDRLNLIDEAADMGGKVIVLAGEGEPSLHKDFYSLINRTNSRKMIPIIYSNGENLTRQKIDFLSETGAVLVISLDSLVPDKYDLITGSEDNFMQTMKNIDYARSIYKKKIELENKIKIMSLAINMTVSGINYKEARKVKDFCGDDIYFICNPLAELGNATSNWKVLSADVDPKDYQGLVKDLSESSGPLTLWHETCGYSKKGISVSPCGDFMTCAYTDKTSGLLGNHRTLSLKNAFLNKQLREQKYYEEYGIAPCLVRSENFLKYVYQLKKKKITTYYNF